MTQPPRRLIDPDSPTVASLDVRFHEGRFEGSISLDAISPETRRVFERFEAIVEGQMFNLLDQIEDEIRSIPFRAQYDDGTEACVTDLQVFPSTGSVSFVVGELATVDSRLDQATR